MGLKETLQIIIKAEDEASKVIKQVQKQTEKLGKTKVSDTGLKDYNKQIKLTEAQLRSLGRYGNQAMKQINTTAPVSQFTKLKNSISSIPAKMKGATSSVISNFKKMGTSTKALFGGSLYMLGAQISSFGYECLNSAKMANRGWTAYKNAFKQVSGSTKVNIDSMKQDVSKLAQVTARSVGETRDSLTSFMMKGLSVQQAMKGVYASSGLVAAGVAKDEVSASKMIIQAMNGRGIALKRLGININDYKNKATGQINTEKLLADITNKTKGAQEEYANSALGQAQRVENAMMALKSSIGQGMLEAIAPLIPTIQKVVEMFSKLPAPVKGVVGGVMLLAMGFTALAPAIMVISTLSTVLNGLNLATRLAAAGQMLLNLAMSLNPVGIVVIAIAGLIAVLVLLYMKCEPVRNLFNSMGQAIYQFAMLLWTKIQYAVQIAINYFRSLVSFISSIPARIGTFIASIPARIMSFLGSIRSSAMLLGRGILNGIIQFVTSIPNRIAQELGKIPSRIMGAVGNAVNAAKNFGKSILNGAMNALGIHSPGFIQNNISNEFEALSGRIKEALPETLNTVKGFGDKLVNSASNFDIKANVTTNPTPTTNATNINTEQAQAELDKLKLIMNTDLNLITNKVSNTLKLINDKLKISFNNNTTYVSAKMKVLLASLTNSTKKMVQSFNTMKNGVVNSARTMQSQTNAWISKLKSNISNFYSSIRHVGGAGGGAGSPTMRRTRPHRSGAGGGASGQNIMKKILKDSIYFKGLKNVDFPLEALLSGSLKHKYGAGGFFDSSKIKNVIRKYKTGNAQVGRYKTSHLSFPVSSFEGKKPKISFSMFKALAEDVFSQISYLFYYDSTRWGSWQNAFRHGQMNCSDGSDALIALAHACGLPASKVHGHWNQYGHFWANVAGHKMDTTGFTLGHGWTPSQSHAGPVPKSFSTDNLNNRNDYSDNLNINGSVTIVHDLRNVPSGLDENTVVELLNKSTVDNPSWIRELVANRTFQNQDRRVKDRLRGNANRSAGI